MKKRRIFAEAPYQEFIELVLASNKYVLYGLTPEIAELSVNLPNEINNDPADRIIAATAIVCHASLITADKNLRQAQCIDTIW